MANEEHLAILRQGIEVWNKWRGKHMGVRPDFAAATALARQPSMDGVSCQCRCECAGVRRCGEPELSDVRSSSAA
jgi:hypothetical protein